MGTPEQDLVRHECEMEADDLQSTALQHAAKVIREEITNDPETLAEVIELAIAGGELDVGVIAAWMVATKGVPHQPGMIAIKAMTAITIINAAIEPLLAAEIERRAPERIKRWQDTAEENRDEAVFVSQAP